MEHPFLDVHQIKEEMTLEQIHEKVTELTNRMSFAYKTNNAVLLNQLTMVFEVYARAQKEKLDELFGRDGKDPTAGKIDIK